MSKPKKIELITPKGTAIGYVTLNAADTKYKPEGEYAVKLAFDDANDPAVVAFVQRLEKERDAFFDAKVEELRAAGKGAAAKQLKKGDILRPELDKETGDETGRVFVVAKMKASGERKDGSKWTQKPTFFNRSGTELKNPPRISSGSVLKLGVTLNPYIMEASKEVAVSLRLNAVQIISVVTRGQRSFESYGFEEEEGDDVFDAENFGAESDDDGPTGEAPGAGDDDL